MGAACVVDGAVVVVGVVVVVLRWAGWLSSYSTVANDQFPSS